MSYEGNGSKFEPKSTWNWDREKNGAKYFFDDGTMTYFWRAHTLTALGFMIFFLLYEVFFNSIIDDDVDNAKRGVIAMISAFILLGVTVMPDGPFKRPHPAVWRFTFILSIVYELVLIFLLYQSASGARKLLKHLDPELGEPLEEKDYGGTCLIYDPDMPDNPYHNVWWIVDTLLCNGLGIYFGLKTMNYLTMKEYHWRGLWNIPSYRGKLRRIFGQFGPYVWVSYDWKPLSSLGRWFTTLGIIAIFLLTELNTFYLKFVLWVPPGHWLNLIRLFLILPWGAVAIREVFQYLDDPTCTEIGRQSWIFLSIVATELFLTLKFGIETVKLPFPRHIIYLWVGIIALIILWSCWNFVIDPHTIKMEQEEITRKKKHWLQVRKIEGKSNFLEFFNETFELHKIFDPKSD